MTRGDRIRKTRKKCGITQEAAARKVDLPVSTWARIERDLTADPKLGTIKKIAKALGIRPAALLD